MIELATAHTANLDTSTRSAIRRLLDAVFDGIGDDGVIYVLPTSVPVDVSGELICDWRHGALW